MTRTAATDLRDALSVAESRGGLARIGKPVSAQGEVTAVLTALEQAGNYSAVLFGNIVGYPGWSIVGNVFADRDNLSAMIGLETRRLTASIGRRLSRPVAPVLVEAGPIHEVVHEGDAASLDKVPIVLHHEKDAAPYISMGLTFTRNPATGDRNVGIYRYMKKDANSLVPSLTSVSNIAEIFRRQEARGRPLDIAIVPGASPAMVIAAGYRAALGVDECALAGGIQQEPVRLVKARTVDVEVPADAEVVIEARLLPGNRYPEAPFADMSRSYSRVKRGPLAEVTAITHRRDPIMQIAFSGHPDATNMASIGSEVAVWHAVQAASSSVEAVHVPASGYGFHCYVALRKAPTIEGNDRGEQKNVMLAALGAVPQLKLVCAFDHDVDIFSDTEVLGALARRFQARDPRTGEERILVIPFLKGATYDPSSYHREYPNSKLMLDATIPSDLSAEERVGFEEARPAWPDEINLEDYPTA